MAKMRIDYNGTVSKGKQIRALSDEVDVILSTLNTLEEELSQNWKGDASRNYMNQCENLSRKLAGIDRKLNEFGNAVIKIANLIKEADERTARAGSRLNGRKY